MSGNPLGGFGALNTHEFAHIFQSPGPIYEPGGVGHDWWRIGRFLNAVGVGRGDIIQNCFGYHLTPAGMIFENGARAVGAAVVPAGVGQTELQVRAAVDIGTTAYAGTPDYLKVILDKADEMGEKLFITKAAVGGGALFPSLRQEYADRGILCLQNYATADLGNVAYESQAMDGMIVDEGVIVEIVIPGTGNPVAPGEVGEVVVTSLNRDYPFDPIRNRRFIGGHGGYVALWPHQYSDQRLDGPRGSNNQDQGHVCAPGTGGRLGRKASRN